MHCTVGLLWLNEIETREHCIVSRDHWILHEGITEAYVSKGYLSLPSWRTFVMLYRYACQYNGHRIEQIM